MDLNTNAFRIVNKLTEENKGENKKSESARKAGMRGGKARAQAITAERRKIIALGANKARWANRSLNKKQPG